MEPSVFSWNKHRAAVRDHAMRRTNSCVLCRPRRTRTCCSVARSRPLWGVDWVVCWSRRRLVSCLHEYSWREAGPSEPGCCKEVAVTTDGTYCWQMTLWARGGGMERGREGPPVSFDMYSISQFSPSNCHPGDTAAHTIPLHLHTYAQR